LDWEPLEQEIAGLAERLEGARLDRARLARLSREVARGSIHPEKNRLGSPPDLPGPGDVDVLEAFAAGERADLERAGSEAIERGEVAVGVLNGGMATRFGGRVKGVVEAIGGRSFLEIKRAGARRLGPVPFVVMNSFATRRSTLEHLRSRGLLDATYAFTQSASLRLTREGEPFRDSAGQLSPYAPGHGDLGEALRESGTLAALVRDGVRVLALSNVDNLGAELDPAIVGYHLWRGRPLTCEVTRARPGDAGGAPLRVDGRLQLVEEFRLPRGFEIESLPLVNTNSMLISLAALARDFPLHWFWVGKRVEGRLAVQPERLVGELSAFLETAVLAVPRSGPAARYYPVKTPADLEALRRDPKLAARFASARSPAVVRG
jgi:UTP--glucose-1-phosphate uridylyltransferase